MNSRGSGPSGKFGTGQPAEIEVRREGPGLGRTFVNGMLFAAGWMTVLGVVKLAKDSWGKNEDDKAPQFSDED